MIYFVKDSTNSFVKIGSSKNVSKCLKTLQASTGSVLEVLGTMPENEFTETGLHMMFSEDRAQGEWFRHSPALSSFIEEHANKFSDGYGLPSGTRLRTVGALGAIIKAYRLKRGLTQAQLASGISASRQWVVDVEKGKISAEVGMIFQVIQFLDIPLGIV